MIINTTDLKENVLGTQNDICNTAYGQNKVSRDAGKNVDGVRDYFSREGVESKAQDAIYSKKEKKPQASGNDTACLDEVTEYIKTMQDNLNSIVNQITSMNYHEAKEYYGISDDTDVHGIVTVVEQIQIKLAAADENYRNTGNLDISEIKAVTGSVGAAYSLASKLSEYSLPATEDNFKSIEDALGKLENIGDISKEQTKYLVENNLEPTIANVYKAQNSTGAWQEQNTLTDESWEQLKPQVKQIISEAFPTTENTQALEDTARWMLENGMALNVENIKKFVQIEAINGQQVDAAQQIDNIIQAVAKGKVAEDTNLTGEHFTGKYVEDTLITMQKTINNRQFEAFEELKVQRQLEEIRLLMTKEAGLSLLKRGIEIDTTDLEMLVEELKKQEREFYQSLGALDGIEVEDGLTDLIRETNKAVSVLRFAPAYIIGEVVRGDFDFTVRASYEASETLLSTIGRVAQTEYEALMTKPDREYGDNIRKAFRNIDVLLEEIGLENTEANNRAVRILSYNQMEISVENVEAVVARDNEYQYLLKNLTPRTVLHCIREGINPLDTDISDLNDRLEMINEKTGPVKEEKFSEFLWKLDNSGEIKESEREAYIGIYRLINMVNRSDGAALGALVNQDAPVTLKNLLTAARSFKSKGMDYRLDAEFGFLENEIVQNSITDQLKIFADDMATEQYENFRKNEYKTLARNEEALKLVLEEGETPNFNNIRVAAHILEANSGMFENFSEHLKGRTNRLLERLTDKTSAVEALKDLESAAYEELAEACENEKEVSFEGLEMLRMTYSGFKFMTSAAVKNESYYVPVDLAGETTTIRLRIVRNSADAGRVTVQFGHETMGRVRAEFKVKSGKLEGFFLSSNAEGIRILKSIQAGFLKDVEKLGLTGGQMNYGISDHMPTSLNETASQGKTVSEEETAAKQTENRTLYSTAQTFLTHIKEVLS